MPVRSMILGPVVAAALVAATGVVAPHGPASAATAAAAVCSGADGVTVIVDYNEVGGPTRAGCDSNGAGQSASQVFPDAGFSLEYHPRQPGYVCKVTSVPDDRPCLENDSFWSLWWSDGDSGEWRFSNQGVGGLTVPDGGYLAFSWHEGGGNAQPPDFAPTPHQAPVDPPDQPSDNSGGNNGGNSGGDDGGNDDGNSGANGGDDGGGSTAAAPSMSASATATGSTTASESASPARGKKRDRQTTEPASPTTSSTVPGAAEITAGPPSSDLATEPSDEGGGALTTWVGLGLAVLVLGAAGLVTVLRRRSG